MAKTSPVEKLNTEIAKILQEYSDDINTNMGIVVRSICGKGVKALRSESATKFNGKYYPKNWKFQLKTGRLYTAGTIYNNEYSMPHLLEYGHALITGGRNAGRVPGRAHIAPVAEQLVEQFEREVVKKL